MANWRDHKRGMRRVVHERMGVPAYFLARRASLPIAIRIRGPHTKSQVDVGSLPAGEGWAEMADIQPRLIFDRQELAAKNIVLVKGVIISVEAGEAYALAKVLPADDNEVSVEVIPLDAAEAEGLPVPGSA